MAITIKRVDAEDYNDDVLIITGKDVLLKLYLKKSFYEFDNRIKGLINLRNLCERNNLRKINRLKELKVKSGKVLEFFRGRTEFVKDFLNGVDSKDDLQRRRDMVKRVEKERLKKAKNDLRDLSDETVKLSKSFGEDLFKEEKLTFCNECNFLVKEGNFSHSLECPICGKNINRTFISSYNFLDKKIFDYLKGDWLADYVARLLRSKQWETWTNLYILGASGIRHEIDILAIHKKTKETLIGECKTGNIGRNDIFTFSIKSQDISSTFAYLFNLVEISENDTKKFMERNGILYAENFTSKKEEELSQEILMNLSNTL